jgi:hypothetical protein
MTGTETIAAITDVVNTYATAMVAGDRAELERVLFENSYEVGHYWSAPTEVVHQLG